MHLGMRRCDCGREGARRGRNPLSQTAVRRRPTGARLRIVGSAAPRLSAHPSSSLVIRLSVNNADYRRWPEVVDKRGRPAQLRSVDYWARKSGADGWDGLSYYAAQPILSVLAPALVRHLSELRGDVLANRDPKYLEMVHDPTILDVDDRNALIDWGDYYEEPSTGGNGMGVLFVQQARSPLRLNRRSPGRTANAKRAAASGRPCSRLEQDGRQFESPYACVVMDDRQSAVVAGPVAGAPVVARDLPRRPSRPAFWR